MVRWHSLTIQSGSFARHRAQDRLRATGCPGDVRWTILGHEEETLAAGYGEGFSGATAEKIERQNRPLTTPHGATDCRHSRPARHARGRERRILEIAAVVLREQITDDGPARLLVWQGP
jgi:hypothetical protein